MTIHERQFIFRALYAGVQTRAAGRCTHQLGLALLEVRRRHRARAPDAGTDSRMEFAMQLPVCRPHLELLHELYAEMQL